MLFPGLLLLLAGCATSHDTTPDPLLGASARAVAATPAPSAGSASAVAAAGPVKPLPPMPAPNALTSNAALTAGGPQPLEGGFDLRIGSNNAGSTWVGPGPPAGAQLSRPEIPAQPVSRSDPQRPATYEQAQALLAAYGPSWQRLECVDGVWKFTCSLPNRQNPKLSRTYEGQAKDDLGAMRAVLEKIEKDQH